METTVHQKEETFQVIIDVIKNSTCFKAFTISAEVLEIFMQQFWYTIKKVKDKESYEFILANKKCVVDAEVFRKILDIYPRVEGEELTEIQDDDATLTFLIDLGYKGPLHKHTSMYVDHIPQPWRTLAAIINKCHFGKTRSNDRLRKSRIDILWGMFYSENVDYPELIWEDFAFQIDHRKEKKSRRETTPFPRFTKVIINHFLSQHKSLSKLKFQHYHTIKDDGIINRLKFIRIREDYQEYGQPIPDMMLNDKIKQSDSYQMFLKYSTGMILPKKSRGKGSQVKKTSNIFQESIDVSDKSEPEPTKKKTGSRSTRGVFIQDTLSAPNLKPAASKLKLKGVPDEEKVTSEENVILEWGSEQESEHSEDSQLNSDEEEKKDNDGDADDNDEDKDVDHISDIHDTYDEDAKTESDKDEIYNYKIQMHKDVDVEMVGAKTVKRENKEKDEMTDAAKADVEKTAKEKGDVELARNAMTSDYQSPSVLKVPVSVIPKTTTLLPIPKIPTKTLVSTALSPPRVTPTISIVQQTTTPIPTPPITTEASTITTSVFESDALSVVQLRVAKLEKDVSELKKIDHSIETLATLKSQVPTVIEHYLGSKIEGTIEKQKILKYTIKSTDKASLKEYDLKNALCQTINENKSFNKNPANHALYHALMEALIEDENVMDNRVADTLNNHKRQYNDDKDDDEDPSAGPNQGTCTSSIELEYNMEECFKALTDKLDWNNPEGDRCPFDLTKPLPLKGRLGHLTVAVEYFFNNDLEFLKSSDPVKKYTTSTTKTKATQYEIVGIKDMVPIFGINKFSKHNVYSTQKILSVVSVKVERLHGYGHLAEIMVRRADSQLYKFKEGDFVDLYLNDIEDMLLLLFNINYSISMKVTLLSLLWPFFSDGTLKTVRNELHHRILDFHLGYKEEMSRRKWTAIDKRRLELMVELIDKKMRERRIIRNLERLVGPRELEMDYRLMTRTE
ncbi:hypothetical protein Tco_0007178 [Tanacetum coccineum]